MRIRTYIGTTPQEALQAMRRELGEDALILSSRTTHTDGREVVEIIATSEQEARSAATPVPHHSSYQDALLFVQLRQEVNQLRQQVAELATFLRYSTAADPRWRQLYQQLVSEGFTEEFLAHRLSPTRPFPSWKEALEQARELLTAHLQCQDLPQPKGASLRLCVVGMPGAGTTTTLLKLLLVYKLSFRLPVWLIATDAYKLGALEQLQLFASVADIPLQEAYTPSELQQALSRLPTVAGVVGVELPTNGSAPELQELWSRFYAVLRPAALYAVVSATDSLPVLRRCFSLWQMVRVSGIIVTKLDQTPGIGALIQALEEYPLPIVCLCAGASIPDDIAPATRGALACRIGTTEST
ncbi:MAG: hypothetical protein NZ960_07620 [Candidatus Kapabacteria bacterium]|nr:hypothetical protein [Candidatus Kapabacteria bacterium]MDW8011988.1 hypothetical protein [Bacteroidota bacterium]